MRVYGTNNMDWWEFACLFLLPALSPIVQLHLNFHLNKDIIGTIVSAASIFAGLLLNLLVLLYSILGTIPKAGPTPAVKDEQLRDLIEHLFYNISFAVLVCVVMVIASLLRLTESGWWLIPAEAIVYYLGAQLFLLVAQILKRFHSLLDFQISGARARQETEEKAVWQSIAPAGHKITVNVAPGDSVPAKEQGRVRPLESP